VRSGANSLCIGMLPGAAGTNRKPVLLLLFRQGASHPLFQQDYAFTTAKQWSPILSNRRHVELEVKIADLEKRAPLCEGTKWLTLGALPMQVE
jgi:hypothetical protein